MKTNYEVGDIFPVSKNMAEVDNLANNDIYKFYMLDFILTHPEYKDLEVERKMTIRSKDIRTADVIPKEQLIEQLKMTQDIVWVGEKDLEYLENLTSSNGEKTFKKETIDFLRTFKLSDFEVKEDGKWNYELLFRWPWQNSMMWEIFWLKIINTLYLYNYIKKENLSKEEFNEIIGKTLWRLLKDIEIFKSESETRFSEFGTRRAMSTNFQRIVNDILERELPWQYLWTSNLMIARERGHKKPIWTNAHELRMIPTALYDDPQDIIDEMYEIDRKWATHHPDLAILLPDTYGTTFYQKNAPQDIIENHIGNRFDSKDPMVAIPEYIDWLVSNGIDPMEKSAIPSDGLNATSAVKITEAFKNKVWFLAFGIGTNLTNNTKWTWPRDNEPYWPFWSFSVVVKPSRVKRPNGEWVSTIKLSDNPEKAVGEISRVEKFKKIFWDQGVKKAEVFV